jgi:hypothetical protein
MKRQNPLLSTRHITKHGSHTEETAIQPQCCAVSLPRIECDIPKTVNKSRICKSLTSEHKSSDPITRSLMQDRLYSPLRDCRPDPDRERWPCHSKIISVFSNLFRKELKRLRWPVKPSSSFDNVPCIAEIRPWLLLLTPWSFLKSFVFPDCYVFWLCGYGPHGEIFEALSINVVHPLTLLLLPLYIA